MTTLSIRAAALPKFAAWPQAVLSRIASALRTALDVFAEAQRQAEQAQRRYPFVS